MLGSPYQGYLYAYPHKTAYRAFDPRPRLRELWAEERTDALFLYVHVPYCEMRCGFCNLFTRANPPAEQVTAYLRQLGEQARRVADAVPGAAYARAAIGGGTPTYLTAAELTKLFDTIESTMDTSLRSVPLSVETSPATATVDRIGALVERGATRISMGVQSFLDTEAHAAGRPQRRTEVEGALEAIRSVGGADLNLDLIYGIDGQTPATWEASLRAALRWQPEELYLYPLYVRPLTGLGRIASVPRTATDSTVDAADADWDARRLALYRQGCALLRAEGYTQLSMRAFRRAEPTESTRSTVDTVDTVDTASAEDYCCQDDGMVGLGCGARSYTSAVHYSFDYAVSVREVRAVLEDYLARPPADFDVAEFGFVLDGVEQRRRWLLKSLLRTEGLDHTRYRDRFGTGVRDDFRQLDDLEQAGYAVDSGGVFRLTGDGLAYSDAVGPWLTSPSVRRAMAGHALR